MATATGTINGHDLSGYVRGVRRTHMLCNPCQVLDLTLSSDFSYEGVPSDTVVISENDTLVFTGYIVKVSREKPSFDWVIEAHDTYTRLSNYFIEDVITVGHDENDKPVEGYTPQSSEYWIDYICGLCGISHSIVSGVARDIPSGVQIGLRTAHESLTDILAFSTQAAYVNPSGVLQIARINKARASHVITSPIKLEDTTSDEWTRTTVKVYGYSGVRGRVFAQASQGIAGIVPDRVTAVASPMIQTQAEAGRVADYLLDELGSKTRIVTALVAGDPTIRIGQAARVVYDTTNYTDAITTIVSILDESGYTTEVTIGERCPRIAGWSDAFIPILAGTSGDGIYRSTDNGVSWAAYNTGLPATRKYVRRIASNYLEEALSIVNGKLYYTDGTNPWEIRSLPAPINLAGDTFHLGGELIDVTSLYLPGQFAVLRTDVASSGSVQQARSWVYESTGSANIWTSTELFDATSGSGFHVAGLSMSSEAGLPYVVGSSGSFYGISSGSANFYIQKGITDRIAATYEGTNPFFDATCVDPGDHGVVDFDFSDLAIEVVGSGPGSYTVFVFNVNCHYAYAGTPVHATYVVGRIQAGYELATEQGVFQYNEGSPSFVVYNYVAPSDSTTQTDVINVRIKSSTVPHRFTMRCYILAVDTTGTDHYHVKTGEPTCAENLFSRYSGYGDSYLSAFVLTGDYDVSLAGEGFYE